MNRTLSFVKLDYLTIKPYLTIKNLLLLLLVFVFIGYGTGESSVLIGMLMMYSMIYASYPFAAEDRNKIGMLYATLPITKNRIVAGRYLFTLGLNAVVGILSFVISALLMTVLKKGFNGEETLTNSLVCFILFSILEAIQLPIYFKFGYMKAKFLVYLPLAAFPAAVIAISTFVGKSNFFPLRERMFLWGREHRLHVAVIALLVWLLAMLCSERLSYRFYRKREL